MKRMGDLEAALLSIYGSTSTHVQSVPVTESEEGHVVWDGVVDVFQLHSHPKATRVYAWSFNTNTDDSTQLYMTVLQLPPILSPLLAVRAIVQGAQLD